MKKLLLFVLLVFIGFSNAQTKEKGTFEITPKIGYSSFSESSEDESTDSRSSASFSITGDYYFNNRWSLRSGLNFDNMGGSYRFGSVRFIDKLNYLSIPINANWHFGSTRKWNLNFGLSPSFLTSAKIESNGKTENLPSGSINSFQLGMTYGIGYKIEINKKFGILIDAQLFSGLTNISADPNLSFFNSGGVYNIGGVFQL